MKKGNNRMRPATVFAFIVFALALIRAAPMKRRFQGRSRQYRSIEGTHNYQHDKHRQDYCSDPSNARKPECENTKVDRCRDEDGNCVNPNHAWTVFHGGFRMDCECNNDCRVTCRF